MRRIYILIDCPQAVNDKQWIERLSVDSFDTIVIDVNERLSDLIRKGLLGRIKNYWLQVKQVLYTLRISDKDDVILVWYSVTGQIMNLLSSWFGGRQLLLLNFLTPSKRPGLLGWMIKKTVWNKHNTIFVNSNETEMQYRNLYGLDIDESARFFFFPDVFDDSEQFFAPKLYKKEEERYFFTGGMTNRNWTIIVELARKFPQTRFVCVAMQSDFNNQVCEKPDNLDVYFNLPSKQYYELMRGAYYVLLPLRNEAVSGLINVLKSIQLGVPCFISETPATRQYYPVDYQYLLIKNDIKYWCEAIKTALSLNQANYETMVQELQKYIKDEFSPEKAIRRITSAVNSVIV